MKLSEPYVHQSSDLEDTLVSLLNVPESWFAKATKEQIPEAPGLYIVNEDGKIVYSGRAQDLRFRLWNQHFLGETPEGRGGSQFRAVLGKVREITNEDAKTAWIREHCSFQFVEWPRINKRDLVFREHFCNAILQPEFLEYGSASRVWTARGHRLSHPGAMIKLTCQDCGNEFSARNRRSWGTYCADCIGLRRKQGRGPRQTGPQATAVSLGKANNSNWR